MKRKNRGYFGLLPNYFWDDINDLFNINNYSYESFDFNKHTSENEGKVEITTGEDESGVWERREWISNDGTSKVTSYTMTSNNFGKKTIDKENLKNQLKKAVDAEDYMLAAKLKKELDSM